MNLLRHALKALVAVLLYFAVGAYAQTATTVDHHVWSFECANTATSTPCGVRFGSQDVRLELGEKVVHDKLSGDITHYAEGGAVKGTFLPNTASWGEPASSGTVAIKRFTGLAYEHECQCRQDSACSPDRSDRVEDCWSVDGLRLGCNTFHDIETDALDVSPFTDTEITSERDEFTAVCVEDGACDEPARYSYPDGRRRVDFWNETGDFRHQGTVQVKIASTDWMSDYPLRRLTSSIIYSTRKARERIVAEAWCRDEFDDGQSRQSQVPRVR